jgi:hypothetical protein
MEAGAAGVVMESGPPVKGDLPGCKVECPAGHFFIISTAKPEPSQYPIVKEGFLVGLDICPHS